MTEVIDWDQLESLSELQEPGEPDLVEGLIASFVGDGRPRMTRIAAAISKCDCAATRMEAHTLKGSAAQLGAGPLAEAAERLEHAAYAGDTERLPALAEELARSMELALAALANPPFRHP